MKFVRHLAVILGIIVATLMFTTTTASAHVPSGDAGCEVQIPSAESPRPAVYAQGTRYSPDDENVLRTEVDGRVKTETFERDGYLAQLIPNDGLPHHWSWSVTTSNQNPNFSAHDSGTIGCGTPPKVYTRHANARPHARDLCSCRRDKAWITYDPAKIRLTSTSHPSKTVWVFRYAGRQVGNVRYLVNGGTGHTGYGPTGRLVVRTTNKPCACVVNHTCHAQHPHAGHHQHCKGKCN